MVKNPCTSSHIANWLLDKAQSSGSAFGNFLSQIQLNKLSYFVYGFYSALFPDNGHLFSDDIEAWKYGPVVPTLYHEFKGFKARPIDKRSCFFDEVNGSMIVPNLTKEENIKNREDILRTLDLVWTMLGTFTPGDLIDVSHDSSGPWYQTLDEEGYSTSNPPHGVEIKPSRIKGYFDKVVENIAAREETWWKVSWENHE